MFYSQKDLMYFNTNMVNTPGNILALILEKVEIYPLKMILFVVSIINITTQSELLSWQLRHLKYCIFMDCILIYSVWGDCQIVFSSIRLVYYHQFECIILVDAESKNTFTMQSKYAPTLCMLGNILAYRCRHIFTQHYKSILRDASIYKMIIIVIGVSSIVNGDHLHLLPPSQKIDNPIFLYEKFTNFFQKKHWPSGVPL